MSKNFTYEISGINNVNLVLPKNGNWYYQYLKNGNIKINGRPKNSDTFSSTEFEQNIQNLGGSIQKGNNLITTNKVNMSDESEIPKDESANKEAKTPTQELKAIEQEIETFLENQDNTINDSSVEGTWLTIELTTKSDISDPNGLSIQLKSHLETKIDTEAQLKIKPLLEEIKKGLKKGKITSAEYTQPTCNPEVAAKKITIVKSKGTPATLKVTIEEAVDSVKVTSEKNYTISANLFSSEVVLGALSEFSEGRTFLNGLTEYTEKFKPNN